MSTGGAERNWQLSIDSDGIAWLALDKAGSDTNTLSQAVLEELGSTLERVFEASPRGLVVRSAKPSGFILGADISEFGQLQSSEQAAEFAARGQALFRRLAAAPFPTVAAINGFALGGGLELALACRYRIAAESYERSLGLPEVRLGIHPGFGGTVRTVALLGGPAALDLMLTGRSVSPVEALPLGLLDRVVPADELGQAAAELIASKPPPKRAPWYLRLANLRPARPLLAIAIRRRVARRAPRKHYPAPYALLELWVRFGARGEAAYAAEARSISELLMSRTCRNLVRVFFLRERLRNLASKSTDVRHVHVVGAGAMGGDIAAWCALRGLDVTLQDRAEKYTGPALTRAKRLFRRRLRGPGEAEAAAARLNVDIEAAQAGHAQLVIEAIVERLDAKQQLFRELEPKLPADTILATNTSSIALEELASMLSHPERFLGLHFFNPVASLPLVEVIRGVETSDAAMQRALAFVTRIGKLPLPCRSAPGFVVNRVLAPYMLEALRAHEDGYLLETIDAAAERFGMPVGPIELADRVGLDVANHVTEILADTLGSDVPAALKRKVGAGELGAKSGKGFYRYRDDRAQKKAKHPEPDEELTDRLILSLVNEAVACHADGIVEDYDLLDAGLVFGTGFAPFTGGPLHYARQRGIPAVVGRLEALAERFGPRFKPHPGWRDLDSGT